MKPGTIVGAVAVAAGLATIAFAALCLTGPLFHWADPMAAEVLQRRAYIAGAAALLLGAAAIVSTRRGSA